MLVRRHDVATERDRRPDERSRQVNAADGFDNDVPCLNRFER